MKKLSLLFLALALLLSIVLFTSCGGTPPEPNNNPPEIQNPGTENPGTDNPGAEPPGTGNPGTGNPGTTTDKEIVGVSFESANFVYNGQEKSIFAANIPDGISAEYENNVATDVGTYSAKVTLSGDGYITKVLTATLVIEKAEIVGVSLAQDQKVIVDEDFHLPVLDGALPDGVSCNWYFNESLSNSGVKDIGKYIVRVVISGKNYETLTLDTTFRIADNLSGLATKVINAFGSTPEPWSFLPDTFNIENFVINPSDIPDYVDFESVANLPDKYIGKQLGVVIGVINKCDTALGYVNIVHGSLNLIAGAYQIFLNDSPENYTTFSDTEGTLQYTITLDGDKYYLNTTVSGVKVTLIANAETKTYGARVEIAANNIIKYEVTETGLKIGMDILDSASTQIEFVRDDENPEIVTGYIYEYLGIKGKDLISTSALLQVTDKYTTVVGTKGDFIPTADSRNCEVYLNSTGAFVGSEVRETLGDDKKTYDTLWYNLKDIAGIYSIRKEDAPNGVNPHTIYINGNTDTIHSMFVELNPFAGLDTSRRFDIEFKNVVVYTYNESEDKYTEVELLIPMLFVQEKFAPGGSIGSIVSDFKKENDVDITINVTSDDAEAINYGYHTLVEAYDTIRNLVTHEDVINYCKSDLK